MSDSFASAFVQPPKVRLVAAFEHAFELGVAAARTCYTQKGMVLPADVSATPQAAELRDRIAAGTLKAGHLTTRQHAHFVFSVEHVSRQLVWSFLHSHPYYNSEQVSQRYVEVKPGAMCVPRLKGAAAVFAACVQRQTQAYQKLTTLLVPVAEREYFKVFPARRKNAADHESTIRKKALEVARYVLPLATHTRLYHTVSLLTLMRYQRLCKMWDAPTEATEVVRQMVAAAIRWDPLLEKDFSSAADAEAFPEHAALREHGRTRVFDAGAAAMFVAEFDQALGGHSAALLSATPDAGKVLAENVRLVLGLSRVALPDPAAIAWALDPSKNTHLSDSLNAGTLSKLARALQQVHFTFRKKISHTADSQNQRHRMTPATRPILATQLTGAPDYVLPRLLELQAEAKSIFCVEMENAFADFSKLVDAGAPLEFTQYVLPNALCVRLVESGDLFNLVHKWKTRLCYNAQEEIFYSTLDEVRAVEAVYPGLTRHLRAPCYPRFYAGVTPACPEGERYCGVPVWKNDFSAYERVL